MKYSLLRTFSANLGDEIQNIAALRFLPSVDGYVDRERMFESEGQPESFMISNGWFMHNPRRFPPPPNIHPFYISLHVDDPALLTPEALEHFRRHEPIGCRDLHTLQLLRMNGIASYFSGCLTWTLPKPDVERTDRVFLVDVSKEVVEALPSEIRSKAVRLSHGLSSGVTFDYHYFYRGENEKLIPEHVPLQGQDAIMFWRFQRARRLLEYYASARLVVTSRIHVFFPCLALGTPAILLKPENVRWPHRYSYELPFIKPYSDLSLDLIDWNPVAPDMEIYRRFLISLTEKAVLLQDNPLKHESIDAYYESSGWHGSGISREWSEE